MDDERTSLLKQIDPWVFWPTAFLSLAFVLWGVLDHESLGTMTGDSARLADREVRLDVRAVDARLPRAGDLPRPQPARQDPARPRRRAARVPHRVVGGDDVQRRDGHRADVLRRHRAALAPGPAAERRRAAQHAGGRERRDGVLLLPLGLPPVGDLRDRRPRARLLRLPQGPAQPHQHRVPADPRRPRRRPGRADDRLARALRHPVRQRDVARPRRAADQRRDGHPLGRRRLERGRRR